MIAVPLLRGLTTLAFVGAFGSAGSAQDDDWMVAVDALRQWGADARFTGSVAPGGEATLEVQVDTGIGYHVYATEGIALSSESPTTITLDALPPGLAPKESWVIPAPHAYEAFGTPTMVYEGPTVFSHVFTVDPGMPAGSHVLTGTVDAMACNDLACQPPGQVAFTATLVVEGGAEVDDGAIVIEDEYGWGVGAVFANERVAPGSTALLRVRIVPEDDRYVYGLESMVTPDWFHTRFELTELPEGIAQPESAVWTTEEPSEADVYGDGSEMVKVFKGPHDFEMPLEIGEDLAPGTYTIRGTAGAMACNKDNCKTPRDDAEFEATIIVDPAAALTQHEVVTAPVGDDSNSKSFWGIVVFCVLGGMVSWLMPCVYPMIPINISFFGKLAEEKSAGRVAVATSYGVGIAGTFVAAGGLVGGLSLLASSEEDKLGYAGLANVVATNPWINLVIGVMFVLFALSMFGLFEIRVPNWLISKTDSAGRSAGSAHVASLMLGVTFALVSFTCTVPVVGLLLGTAAEGTWLGFWKCILGMVVYGAVFAAPFVLLSMFPGALKSMPKAGGWMDSVKICFGFLEVAVAIKFLWVPDLEWGWGVLTRPVVLVLFMLVGIATLSYLFGLLRLGYGPHPKPFRVGLGRNVIAAITIALLVPVGMSLNAAPTYTALGLQRGVASTLEALLPPALAGDDLARKEGWFIDDYEGALAKAKAEGKPLFLDFTGVYCANCRAMENTVFHQADIKERFDQMVLARLYVDRKEEHHAWFQRMQVERYGVSSQPYYVVIDPSDESALSQDGGWIPDSFIEVLDEGLSKFKGAPKP